MLDEVREITAGISTSFDAIPKAESLRELDRLVGMAKHPEEIAVSTKNNRTVFQKLLSVKT